MVVVQAAVAAEEDALDRFVARVAPVVTSVLSGFDRVVFRGALRSIRDRGMHVFLMRAGIRLLDFADFGRQTSTRVERACLAEAERADRPIRYLERSSTSKEQLAHAILGENPVQRGLICAFKVVEPCMSFEYFKSQDRRARGLRLVPGKCLHVYKYYRHPRFGFMSARLQTWSPFDVQICINGREWLAGALERRRSGFQRADNCFTWLKNPEFAQRLMDEQPWPMNYYWIGYQTEWATDVMFKTPSALQGIYGTLVRHAMEHFQSPDVLRFLGERQPCDSFTGEITTRFKDRPEGVRVKHWSRGNSLKMYDKAGSLLRVETTLANPKDFKVYRPKSTAARRSRSARTTPTSTRSRSLRTPRPAGSSSIPSAGRRSTMAGAIERSGSVPPRTASCSKTSPAANSRLPAFATATCGAC